MPDVIPTRLLENARTRPDAPAYHVKAGNEWKATSWGRFGEECQRAARALMTLGFRQGDTVCILGFNRPEWLIADHAAMLAGGAAAGIYTTCSPDEVAYIVDHADAPVVFLENLDQWKKIEARRDQLHKLRHVVMFRGAPKISDPLVLSWEELDAKADETPDAALQQRVAAIEPSALAQLIYTSGTTGPPKGVMLSHRNLAWTAGIARDLAGAGPDDSSLSYLPLSHIAEQMFSMHVPATVGSQIYFAESMEKLKDNLEEVQPTIFFGVPRVWEKFHAGITAKTKLATGFKKRMLEWALSVGAQTTALRNEGKAPGGLLALQHRLAKRLVLDKIKAAVGLSRTQFAVSGAAPIARDVLEFFGALDLTVLEVYGQSEGTGPTTFNRPGQTRFGTVGPAIPGVEVKIAEDGEILLRGPNVFMGYFKEPQATAETLVDDWLHSGDLGAFEDGFLSITGRKKEIIITAGGKNVAPKNIEAEIKRSELIAEAVVIGDRRKFLSALIVLDDEAAARFLAERGLQGDAKAHPDVHAEIQKAVDACNAQFARVEWVRKWRVLPRPLSIDGGELTPTLKIKRKKVEEHFSGVLAEIYADDEAAA